MLYTSRNYALAFARRTRKNLEYIERASKAGEDVHVVTQLTNSLLGLIVFPREKHFVEHIKTLRLDELSKDSWPQWEITSGDSRTLGQLLRYLRNATAHGHIEFSSDSRNIDEVVIRVENYPSHHATTPDWSARIAARELREFCLRLIDLLEHTIG